MKNAYAETEFDFGKGYVLKDLLHLDPKLLVDVTLNSEVRKFLPLTQHLC